MSGRRTRRAEKQPPAAAAEYVGTLAKIVSNPIFYCEDGSSRLRPIDLRRGYGPDVSVHDAGDPAAASGGSKPLPLPLPLPLPPPPPPPSRVMSPRRRALRRAPAQDPFLAAYVACTKGGDGAAAAAAGKNAVKQLRKKTKKRGEAVRGCGMWGAGKKYAGVMSCKYGCAVAAVQEDADAPAAAAQAQARKQAEPPAGPTLNLSRPPVMLPARGRALERRRDGRGAVQEIQGQI